MRSRFPSRNYTFYFPPVIFTPKSLFRKLPFLPRFGSVRNHKLF